MIASDMRGCRVVLACLIALFCFLAPARESRAGTQRDDICQGCGDGPGCTPCPTSDGSSSSSRNPGIAWGGMTKRNMEMVGRDCSGKPLCFLVQGTIGLLGGAITDVPYYAVKGVGYGLYYGGKGLYLGARGLGKGLAYTGRSIGRGIAYPFNRPPKAKLPPTTWEQYKHDVLRHQKALTKANKANKANQRWCMSRVPLDASANRAEWEARCNPGDAVSRAALPPDLLAPAPSPDPIMPPEISPDVPIAAASITGMPAAATPVVEASGPTPDQQGPTEQDKVGVNENPTTAESSPGAVQGDSPETSVIPAPQTASKDATESSAEIKAPLTPFTHAEPPDIEQAGAPEPFIGNDTPALLSNVSAPTSPSAFGSPEQVGAALAPDIRPTTPEAFESIRRAAGFVAKRGLDRTREVASKTAKKAVSTEFGPAAILINMYELPETILPRIIKISKAELSIEEGDMLTFESVNVLYNVGAAPNKVLAKIFAKRDVKQGLLAYGIDEAVDKLSLTTGKGIANVAGKMHADSRYPLIARLDGSVAGRVRTMLHEGREYTTKKDIRRAAVGVKDWIKEASAAQQAIYEEKPKGELP